MFTNNAGNRSLNLLFHFKTLMLNCSIKNGYQPFSLRNMSQVQDNSALLIVACSCEYSEFVSFFYCKHFVSSQILSDFIPVTND